MYIDATFVRNLACWTFVYPLRNLVQPAPGINGSINVRYSADPPEGCFWPGLDPYPRVLLKLCCPSAVKPQIVPSHKNVQNFWIELPKIMPLYPKMVSFSACPETQSK